MSLERKIAEIAEKLKRASPKQRDKLLEELDDILEKSNTFDIDAESDVESSNEQDI